ncbi:16929_t:CDS:2, partial [Dentiscutata erythropus]
YQTISIFTWIWFPLSVYYCRTVPIFWVIPVFIANSIGTALAFLGSLNHDNSNWLPEYFLACALFGFGMNILLCISLLFDKFAQNDTKQYQYLCGYGFPCPFGTTLAFLGSLNTNDSNWLPEYFLFAAALGFGMNILSCISLAIDKMAQNVFKGWPRFLVFPCIWTGL